MKGYAKVKGGGKTYDLLHEHFFRYPCIMLLHSQNEKNKLIEKHRISITHAQRMFVFTDPDIKEKLQGINLPIIIDDVDMFLWLYFRKNVTAVSYNGSEEQGIKTVF